MVPDWDYLCVVIILGLLGGRGTKPIRKNVARLVTDDVDDDVVASDLESDEEVEIPAPVISDNNLDGVSLRDRKLAKIQAANSSGNDDEDDGEELVEVEVAVENVHTADEYVVEVSPESVEDADIEMTVSNRRVKHQEIRERIEKRRRNQLADIRASTVRMWEQTMKEKILALLQNPQHGLNVIDEPRSQRQCVYGATFIRLDDNNIEITNTP